MLFSIGETLDFRKNYDEFFKHLLFWGNCNAKLSTLLSIINTYCIPNYCIPTYCMPTYCIPTFWKLGSNTYLLVGFETITLQLLHQLFAGNADPVKPYLVCRKFFATNLFYPNKISFWPNQINSDASAPSPFR